MCTSDFYTLFYFSSRDSDFSQTSNFAKVVQGKPLNKIFVRESLISKSVTCSPPPVMCQAQTVRHVGGREMWWEIFPFWKPISSQALYSGRAAVAAQ